MPGDQQQHQGGEPVEAQDEVDAEPGDPLDRLRAHVAVDDAGQSCGQPRQRGERGEAGDEERQAATGQRSRRCHQAGADDQVEGEQQDHRPAAP